jgi:hypothetical protein
MNNSDIARQLGAAGGRKSVKKRLIDKTNVEISAIMKDVRAKRPVKEKLYGKENTK